MGFDNFLTTVIDRPNCELIKNLFRGQPVNLLTNVAFFITAFALFRLFRKYHVRNFSFWLMLLLLILLGIGSALNHSVPNNLTLFLDGFPVLALFFVGLVVLFRHLLGGGNTKSVVFAGLVILAQFPISLLLETPLKPSIFLYIINLLSFGLLILFTILKLGFKNIQKLLLSFVLFGLAVTSLILDETQCPHLPFFGTHFIWHIFTAGAIYYYVAFLVKIEKDK